MQAICQRCGKTITPEDFRAGRYLLFRITPTIPSDSLYLCQACRGISWEEQERLFDAWMQRQQARPHARKSTRKQRSLIR